MTDKDNQRPGPAQVAAVLRQRMASELRFDAGAHRMSITRDPADNPFGIASDNSNNHVCHDLHWHSHPALTHRSIPVFQGELEILLDYLESLERQINAHPPAETDPDA